MTKYKQFTRNKKRMRRRKITNKRKYKKRGGVNTSSISGQAPSSNLSSLPSIPSSLSIPKGKRRKRKPR